MTLMLLGLKRWWLLSSPADVGVADLEEETAVV